MPAEPVG
jgi:hypothetical protein